MSIYRAAVWYLNNWRILTVPFKLKIKPLTKWKEFFGAEPTAENLMKLWSNVKGASALAAVYTAGTKAVYIDIDAYRVSIPKETVIAWATTLSKYFPVAITPRGGLRLVFEAVDEPFHVVEVLTEDGESVGEGAYDAPHLWHLPPSYGCVDKECKQPAPYVFWVGRPVRYPWATPWQRLPKYAFSDVVKLVKEVTGLLIVEKKKKEKKKEGGGQIVRRSAPPTAIIVPPCWRDLKDFDNWLKTSRTPPLPACVAKALGYRVRNGAMEWTGEEVKEGERFVYGAAVVMFLAACIDRVTPDEIIEYVGRNLEDFPRDTGTSLDKKLSYLLEEVEGTAVPRYIGLGESIGMRISECDACPYRVYCRGGQFGDRYVPWWPYAIAFLRAYPTKWLSPTARG